MRRQAAPLGGLLNQQEGDMGLLDAVAGAIGGGGGGQGDLMQLVMKLVQDNGGLEGLVSKFQQGGLGDVVQSWVSTGPNLPISPEQLGQALGPDTLSQLGAGGQDLLG
ncbi:MAG: YidB family protein, partial [Rubrivivax sp.]